MLKIKNIRNHHPDIYIYINKNIHQPTTNFQNRHLPFHPELPKTNHLSAAISVGDVAVKPVTSVKVDGCNLHL